MIILNLTKMKLINDISTTKIKLNNLLNFISLKDNILINKVKYILAVFTEL